MLSGRKSGTINSPEIVNTFEKVFEGLDFTYEIPHKTRIRLLDIQIEEYLSHTCWSYTTKGEKGLSRYDSGHSKLVKRSIAFSSMMQSIKKSCDHKIKDSLAVQVERLKKKKADTRISCSLQ